MRLCRLIVLALVWSAYGLTCDCVRIKTFCEQPPDPGARDLAVFAGTVMEQYPPLAASPTPREIEAVLGRWKDALTNAEFQDAWKNKRHPSGSRRLFRLRVTEIFQGSPGGEVVMVGGLSDCDFQFRPAGTYLVAANKTENPLQWRTTICSQTRLIGDAQGEVRALRAWKKGETLNQLLYGRVLDYTSRAGAYAERPKPLAGVRVRLDLGGAIRDAVTDRAGGFLFEDIKPGSFRLTADLKPLSFERVNAGNLSRFDAKCQQVNVRLTETQAVQGRVVQRASVQASGIEVQLVPVGGGAVWPRDIAMVSSDGSFALSSLEPGKYVLQARVWSFPMPVPTSDRAPQAVYYPGVVDQSAAQVLLVKRGEILQLPNWILTAPASAPHPIQ
jgi:hypothetical protein